MFSGGTLQFLNAFIIQASRGFAGLRLGLALIEYTHSHQCQSKSELRTISRSRGIIRFCRPFVLSNFHVLYFGSYLGTQSTSVGHLALNWIRSRADCSIESKLYLTSVRALDHELPLISSCVVQHQISDLFVVTLEMRYLMTQGTFGARISCAVDHMHPA